MIKLNEQNVSGKTEKKRNETKSQNEKRSEVEQTILACLFNRLSL